MFGNYIFLLINSIIFRFDISFRNFNKEVGYEPLDTKAGTGYQNAIIPSKLNWLNYAEYILLAMMIFRLLFNYSASETLDKINPTVIL